jgi:hypothetical protein
VKAKSLPEFLGKCGARERMVAHRVSQLSHLVPPHQPFIVFNLITKSSLDLTFIVVFVKLGIVELIIVLGITHEKRLPHATRAVAALLRKVI